MNVQKKWVRAVAIVVCLTMVVTSVLFLVEII